MESNPRAKRKPNPRQNASPLSVATFWYTLPTFVQGFKRDLVESDLTETFSEHKSSKLGNKMERAWKGEEVRAAKFGCDPSLQRVLFKVFGLEFAYYGVVLALCEAVNILQPLALGQLLKFYQPNSEEISQGEAYWYAGGVVLSSLVWVVIMHPYFMGMQHLGMKMRVGCCSLIYRKSLKLSKTALGHTTVGQVVNLLSNDVKRFDEAVIFTHTLWLGPVETLVCTYLMYLHLGYSAVIGVTFLLLFIPVQILLGRQISVFRQITALRTDERVRLMHVVISGIQVIKMYAWEKPFAKLVSHARRYEIQSIRVSSYMRGIVLSFIMYTTRTSIFATILAYVLFGNEITAEKVFVLTSFYNILRKTMTLFFTQAITQTAEARASIGRLNKFLLYDETQIAKDMKKAQQASKTDADRYISNSNGVITSSVEVGIFMTNATARWSETSTDNTLNEVNLRATPGKLVALIGPVGGGKTSLFHVILKELPLIDGTLAVHGDISYASQEPWLFAGSVRQNILFGRPMDESRYRTVIKRCALERDFALLPYGDKTIVGDRGVTVSGGQRARINLARAVYKQADIYLLDDPLSAVDTHVGKQLFENCIAGYLKSKTVVLITHQLQYLKDVDRIIYLDNGRVKAEGSFKELQASGLDFTKLLGKAVQEEDQKKKQDKLMRKESVRSVESEEGEAPQQVEEQRSTGSVGARVYGAYFKAGGNCCVIFVLFALFVLTQIAASLADYYITYWVNLEQEDPGDGFWDFSRETSIIIYSVIMGLLITLTLVRSLTFFAVCMRASTTLHDNMFASITRATMRFFNTNSAGRILNRFSKDMGSVDELLTKAMLDCAQIGLTLVCSIIVVAVVSPWLMIPTVIVGFTFYFLRIVYVRTSRNIKRLDGITRSPVFSHLNASLQGLTTIRALGAQKILQEEFDDYQDVHSSAWDVFLSTSRGFGYALDVVCIIYLTVVTFSFLMIGHEKFGGNVGLAITQVIGLTGLFQWGMRQSAELENQMTSVERVLEYNNVEHEGRLESTPDKKPPRLWPTQGQIEFVDVFLRYFPDSPPVLKGLTFTVRPREKIGIVGRTGAGKSSLINALFRLTEIDGAIVIDGINVHEIGLHDLRSKISIIPQEPVLFSGTMRKNLDPFDEYSDAELWRALEAVELKEMADLTGGLDSKMSEGGSNFSVGQRQLVCLARAILRNNRILVLDEATANTDPRTDGLIQTTIRSKFSDCTVLTIAHRLHTVMDSDKILVMDAGTMREFDHAYNLLQNTNGVFYRMVQETGKAMAETLHNVAKESFTKSQQS